MIPIAIALSTFKELVRSKILYLSLVFLILIVLISTFFGKTTIGDELKIIKDFGLFCVSLFSVLFCVISGALLLQKELSKKTIYNILSKSVTRWQFVFGKYLGMVITSVYLICIMSGILSIYIAFLEKKFDVLLLQAYFFIVLEILIVCSATMFFSCVVVTPLLSGLFSFGLFLIGRSSDYIVKYKDSVEGMLPKKILSVIYYIIPDLNLLNISNDIVYGISRDTVYCLYAVLYSLCYAFILIVLGSIYFSRKEFT
jgi:Cu-processing system permease protein